MEYIDRDTAVSGLNRVIENLRKEATTHIANRAVDLVQYSRDYIQSLPAADVAPVVRCQECKHLNVVNNEKLYAHCPKTNTVFLPFQIDTRTHFCSLGERR